MKYLELKEKIEKAISDKDVDAVLELFTVKNAITLRDYNLGFSQRVIHYAVLRKNFKELKDVSDETFETIFNSGLTTDEKNKMLADLGIKIEKPKTGIWRPFK